MFLVSVTKNSIAAPIGELLAHSHNHSQTGEDYQILVQVGQPIGDATST
jgi:hypothetical protein